MPASSIPTPPGGAGPHRLALLTASATLCLLGIGGLVTSHGVGMSVPDWPNTYGYNMFFFPFSKWVGGIFYEHSHRLVASGVGLLTTLLALWLHGSIARPWLRWPGLLLILAGIATAFKAPHRGQDAAVLLIVGLLAFLASFLWPRRTPSPRWLRRLGLIAFFGVVLQGILGGLRVTAIKDELGIFHATLAQLFFCLICSITLFTSSWWRSGSHKNTAPPATRGLHRFFLLGTLLILAQLTLGAVIRHQHAGLAIPDFPLAHGTLWPDTSEPAITRYNQQRLEIIAAKPITATQIHLQMTHRILAVIILATILASARTAISRLGAKSFHGRISLVWAGLILLQVLLGVATIWSNKAADVATAHVLCGALALALGTVACIVSIQNLSSKRDDGSTTLR